MRTRKFLSTLIPALPLLVTAIFLTAMRSKAHAQLGGVEQPMFSSPQTGQSFPGPTSITNLWIWWSATDLPANVIVSNQWIDRITSHHADQMNTSVAPTNNPNAGVRFNGSSHFLTNDIVLANQSIGACFGSLPGDVFFFVYVPDGAAGNKGVFSKFNAPYGAYHVSSSLQYAGSVSGGPNAIASVTSGTTNDVIAAYERIDESNWRLTWYLNGIPVKTNITSGVDSYQYTTMGRSSLGYWPGYIRDNGIYTNIYWTDARSVILHSYFTNLYGPYP